jgi:hypothetical protein
MFSGEILAQITAADLLPNRKKTELPGTPDWPKMNKKAVANWQIRVSNANTGIRLRFPVNQAQFAAFDFEKEIRMDYWTGKISPAAVREGFSLRLKPEIAVCSYTSTLGFFCQKEIQIQKLTSLPIYFRLGSLQYVNYLEQKPNAVKPGF